MTKIIKICEMISLVEINKKNWNYCTKIEDDNKLIIQISIMENKSFYDLIIQKIMGNKFNFITFYGYILDKIKKKD